MTWIDVLRGVTILLVVIHHCDYILHGNLILAECTKSTWLFLQFRMPLFFFLTGYFAFSSDISKVLIKRRIRNRLICQLVPTLVICGITYFIFRGSAVHYDIAAWLFSPKNGGWFALVAFESYCCFLILMIMTRTISSKWCCHKILYAVLSIGVMLFSTWLCDYYFSLRQSGRGVTSLLNLYHMTKYLPFFLLGTLVRMNFDVLVKYLSKNALIYIAGVSCIVWCIGYTFSGKPSYACILLLPVCISIISVFMGFYLMRNHINDSNIVCRRLAFLGRNTLQIYLLHSSFIFLLTVLTGIQILIGLIYDNDLALGIFYIIIAILVAESCMFVDKLLKITCVHRYVFPPAKH